MISLAILDFAFFVPPPSFFFRPNKTADSRRRTARAVTIHPDVGQTGLRWNGSSGHHRPICRHLADFYCFPHFFESPCGFAGENWAEGQGMRHEPMAINKFLRLATFTPMEAWKYS